MFQPELVFTQLSLINQDFIAIDAGAGKLHQSISESCKDLAKFFKTKVVDALSHSSFFEPGGALAYLHRQGVDVEAVGGDA